MRTLALLVVLIHCVMATAEEARPLVTAGNSGPNLLQDGRWQPVTPAANARSAGLFSIDNQQDATTTSGVHQSILLNQARPIPVIAEVESRALDVGGQSNSDYSLYLDIIYTDGTPLWGQIATFPTGNSPWQRRQVVVLPEKPIRSVELYLLLRRHSGKAEFREPVLAQVTADDVAVFDGLIVRRGQANGPELLVRNVTANSGFTAVRHGAAPTTPSSDWSTLDTVIARIEAGPGDDDQAMTAIQVFPLPEGTWNWLRDPLTTVKPTSHRDYVNALSCGAGARGLLSRYPFAAVSDGQRGYGVAIDMDSPVVFRAGFCSDTRELYVACDIATTRERPQAGFQVRPFTFDGAGGFRTALAKYHELNPDAFKVRAKHQGLWMPFAPISKVENWQDFGFAFKEGNDETKWDDQHDILTFRYTEPLTWWMALPAGTPRTYEAALAHAQAMADQKKPDAQALFTSGYRNAAGEVAGRFQKQPWCDGIVWSMNSSPGIAQPPSHFATKWNPTIREALYGAKAQGQLDGEYIDSSEGYVTDELDFNREHFAAMQTPLSFDPVSHRPVIFRGLITFEYIRGIARDVHAMDRLMMANGTPGSLPWLAPMLDVMGTETDWNPGGKWQPMSLEELLYRRALCGGKPYCFLMNTNFDQFPPDRVEKYMQRCMAFGMFPGFFSHNASEKQYFQNPALYNRDRPLFQKYIPLCRTLAEAGWKPVTGATSSNPAVHLERFGDRYLTALNTSAQRQSAAIAFSPPKPPSQCIALPGGKQIAIRDASLQVDLEPEEAVVLDTQ